MMCQLCLWITMIYRFIIDLFTPLQKPIDLYTLYHKGLFNAILMQLIILQFVICRWSILLRHSYTWSTSHVTAIYLHLNQLRRLVRVDCWVHFSWFVYGLIYLLIYIYIYMYIYMGVICMPVWKERFFQNLVIWNVLL